MMFLCKKSELPDFFLSSRIIKRFKFILDQVYVSNSTERYELTFAQSILQVYTDIYTKD